MKKLLAKIPERFLNGQTFMAISSFGFAVAVLILALEAERAPPKPEFAKVTKKPKHSICKTPDGEKTNISDPKELQNCVENKGEVTSMESE